MARYQAPVFRASYSKRTVNLRMLDGGQVRIKGDALMLGYQDGKGTYWAYQVPLRVLEQILQEHQRREGYGSATSRPEGTCQTADH